MALFRRNAPPKIVDRFISIPYTAYARTLPTQCVPTRLLRSLLCSSSSPSFPPSFLPPFPPGFFWLALCRRNVSTRGGAFMQMRSLYARPVLSSFTIPLFLRHNQKFYGPPAHFTRMHICSNQVPSHKTAL